MAHMGRATETPESVGCNGLLAAIPDSLNGNLGMQDTRGNACSGRRKR